jgi:hypothetical protein
VLEAHQVLAFRVSANNLARRLPPASRREAAAFGLQDTPPGSAELALHARVSDLAPEDFERDLTQDKSLVQVGSLRGAPYVVPTQDVGVFTRGLLPTSEIARRHFVLGAIPALEKIGIPLTELTRRTSAALDDVLDGRELTRDELGIQIALAIEPGLTMSQLRSWRAPSWYAPRQRLGEAAVRFALSLVALEGKLCYAPRRGNSAAVFRLTHQWLGGKVPRIPSRQARAELVRRYLRIYGPSTARHFAEWTGTSPAQAAASWRLVADELEPFELGDRRGWLLREDIPRLLSPPEPKGVRLLPPHDPLLALRDRETLVPNPAHHPRLWRPVGNPGAVLADGQLVAGWRPNKAGKRLRLTIEMFSALPKGTRSEIEAEAWALAPHRGCTSVDLAFKKSP